MGRKTATHSIQQKLEKAELAPEIPRLEELVGFLLRCASNTLDSHFSKNAGDLDITPSQLAVLLTLSRRSDVTQTELSVLTRIDKSTINEMVPRMSQRRLLIRSKSSSDKRVIQLSISPSGIELLKKATVAATTAQEKTLEAIPSEYRKIFRHCLEMILDSSRPSTEAVSTTP